MGSPITPVQAPSPPRRQRNAWPQLRVCSRSSSAAATGSRPLLDVTPVGADLDLDLEARVEPLGARHDLARQLADRGELIARPLEDQLLAALQDQASRQPALGQPA